MTEMFIENDGGREAAGYKGNAGDCTVRAIAIATGKPYQEVYGELFAENKLHNPRNSSPRNGGTQMKTIHKYLKSLGWSWFPTMQIGSGCKVHLKQDELPSGNIIVRLSGHLLAISARSAVVCSGAVMKFGKDNNCRFIGITELIDDKYFMFIQKVELHQK